MAPSDQPAPDEGGGRKSAASERRTTGVSGGTNAIGSSLTAAVAVALFAWGGMKLDQRWDSQPWMLLLGASIGGLGGFLYMLKELAPDMLPWSTEAGEDEPGAAKRPRNDGSTDGEDA